MRNVHLAAVTYHNGVAGEPVGAVCGSASYRLLAFPLAKPRTMCSATLMPNKSCAHGSDRMHSYDADRVCLRFSVLSLNG